MQQPSYPPPGYDPYAQQKKPLTGWLIAGGVLFAALIGFGFGTGFFGLLGGSKPALNQQGQPQAVLPQVSAPAPVFMQEAEVAPITPQEAKRMPQEILDWLKHLEETEKRFTRVTNDGIGKALPLLTEALNFGATAEAVKALTEGDIDALEQNSVAKSGAAIADSFETEANEVRTFFRSVQPPAECVPIYNSYTSALNEATANTKEILKQMTATEGSTSERVGKLIGQSGQSKQRIGAVRAETDNLVQQICSRYETRKWFSITPDIGGGLDGILNALKGLGGGLSPMP